jgi:flagellar basal body-associated protein FliL
MRSPTSRGDVTRSGSGALVWVLVAIGLVSLVAAALIAVFFVLPSYQDRAGAGEPDAAPAPTASAPSAAPAPNGAR